MKLRILGILLVGVPCVIETWGQSSIDTIPTHHMQEVVVTDISARNRVRTAKLGSENLELTRLASAPKCLAKRIL